MVRVGAERCAECGIHDRILLHVTICYDHYPEDEKGQEREHQEKEVQRLCLDCVRGTGGVWRGVQSSEG